MDVREKLVDVERAAEWFEKRAENTPMPMARKMFESAGEALREKANGVTVHEWISVDERIPQNFVSVLGYMTDAGEFPPVRECYTVGNAFFFPALGDVHPVSHWCEMPQPPKVE